MSMALQKKALDALSRSLRPLADEKPLTAEQQTAALKKALAALNGLDLAGLRSELERRRDELEQKATTDLARRREDLLRAAREQSIPHKRFSEYDRVGPFKVSYKGKKVALELGSEKMVELEELNGARLLTALQDRMTELDKDPFSREEFFACLKEAFRMAKERGLAAEGRFPIKRIFPFFVLAKQARRDAFLQKPSTKTFQEYPVYQFVYDLARFGRDGWRLGDEMLRTQTPNMATISQGKAMMLPALDSQDGTGQQVAVVWIEKREG